MDRDAEVPATDCAVTVIAFCPDCNAIGPAIQVRVPAAAPLPPRAFDHRTREIPLEWSAVPASVTDAAADV